MENLLTHLIIDGTTYKIASESGEDSNGTFGGMRPDQYDGWLSIEWENAE